MARLNTTIAGYLVELETEGETGCDTTQCTVSRGPYSASLELLMAEGHLIWTLSGGLEKYERIQGSTLGEIENWAYRNGY